MKLATDTLQSIALILGGVLALMHNHKIKKLERALAARREDE